MVIVTYMKMKILRIVQIVRRLAVEIMHVLMMRIQQLVLGIVYLIVVMDSVMLMKTKKGEMSRTHQ